MRSLGIEPKTFCTANAMLYHWATGTFILDCFRGDYFVFVYAHLKSHLSLDLMLHSQANRGQVCNTKGINISNKSNMLYLLFSNSVLFTAVRSSWLEAWMASFSLTTYPKALFSSKLSHRWASLSCKHSLSSRWASISSLRPESLLSSTSLSSLLKRSTWKREMRGKD